MTDTRPHSDPAKPGKKDAKGVEWWACDPYPTWYRWDNGTLIERDDDGEFVVWERVRAEREATDVVADAPDSATDQHIGAESS